MVKQQSKLNENPEIHSYELFKGRYVDTMPVLRAEGRMPMSISALMKRRLEVLGSKDKELIEAWWGDGHAMGAYDSSTGIAMFNDEIKVVPNAEPLLNVNRDSQLYRGALFMTEKKYDAMKGPIFSRKELRKAGQGKNMTRDQILEHPLWLAAAESDDLRGDYIDAQMQRLGNKKMMSVYTAGSYSAPTMRELILGGGSGGWRSCLIAGALGLEGDLIGKKA